MDFWSAVILLNLLFWSLVVVSCYMTARSDGLVGRINQAVRHWIWQSMLSFIECIPATWRRNLAAAMNYVFFTRNCIFQVLYLVLVVTGHFVVINDGLLIVRHVDPETSHLFWPLTILTVNMILFIVCSYINPGTLDKYNFAQHLSIYPYDKLIYLPDTRCTSCGFMKPARSKHCNVFNRCVYKFDHYCIWIRNCVGGNNHRYFLLLLASLAVMCIHGALATFKVIRAVIQVFGLRNAKYLDAVSGNPIQITNYVLFQILSNRFPRLVFMETALIVISFIVCSFLVYHFYLAATNQTTNERYKTYHLKRAGNDSVTNSFYNRGLFKNLYEEIFPPHTRVKVFFKQE